MNNLLAAVVEVIESPEGDHVIVDPLMPMLISAVYLFLVLLPILVILLFFFYRKKLQHQQILAAIEKGMPVQDLLVTPAKKETGWIPNFSAGIGLLFIAVMLVILYFQVDVYRTGRISSLGFAAIPVVLAGIGISRLLRGIFQRSSQKQEDTVKNDANATPSTE